uniref:site-specific integrase n=1 Tax=Flavobacterium sp. TaxID=239 RepID=UPI0040485225
MSTNLQAYQDYLVKEKNYSPLTVRAYLDDIQSFQEYLLGQSISLVEVVLGSLIVIPLAAGY